MAKLSDSRLVFTSAYGARDPIQTGAGTTPAIHNGADFGPEKRNTPGIRLNSIISGSVTWLSDQYGALGVRTTTTATGSLLQLLRDLYGGVLEGASVSVSLWHLASRVAQRGAEVVAGAVLGIMGSTGRSTGIHVHVELRIGGRIVDPKPFIDAQASKAVADAPADYYGEGFLMALTADEQRDLAVRIERIDQALTQNGFYMTNAILDDQRRAERGLLDALAALATKGVQTGEVVGKVHDTTGRLERRQIEQGWLLGKQWDHMTGKPEGTTVALTAEDREALIQGIAAMLDRDADAVRAVGEALLKVADSEPGSPS